MALSNCVKLFAWTDSSLQKISKSHFLINRTQNWNVTTNPRCWQNFQRTLPCSRNISGLQRHIKNGYNFPILLKNLTSNPIQFYSSMGEFEYKETRFVGQSNFQTFIYGVWIARHKLRSYLACFMKLLILFICSMSGSSTILNFVLPVSGTHPLSTVGVTCVR